MSGEYRHPKRYEAVGEVRFLTFSCYQRLALFNNAMIRDLFAQYLESSRLELGFRLHAWVIMPNHIHLMLVPSLPDAPVRRILYGLKRPFAREVLSRWRRLNAPILDRIIDRNGRPRFWLRGGGYDRNIVTEAELIEKTDYIHSNPQRAGLRAWRWSSLAWYQGMRDGPVMVEPIAL